MVFHVPEVDPATSRLPDVVRDRLAKDFEDRSTPEGAAVDRVARRAPFEPVGLSPETLAKVEPAGLSEETQVQLSATYAGAQVPGDVAPRSGQFDVAKSIYFPAGADLRRTRAKMAAVAAGVAGARCKIAYVGHSEVAGLGSTVGVTSPGVSLRNLIAMRYPVGSGLVPVFCNIGSGTTKDSRWAYSFGSAAWEYTGGAAGSGNMQFHLRATQTGKTATFTSDMKGTVVEIFTFGNSAPFNYSIDGGAATLYTPSGSSAIEVVTVTGLTSATHTVAITTVGTAATYLLGAAVRPATAVEVSALGLSGARASDWQPGQLFYNPYPTSTAYGPDLALIQLDVNEALNGVAVEMFRTNLTNIVNGYKGLGVDVALVASPTPSAAEGATWSSFRDVVYDIADAAQVPLVDVTHRFGTYAEANGNGLMFDVTHPDPAGYAEQASAIYSLLAPAS